MSRCERQDRDAYPQGRVQSRAICELKGGCSPIRRFYFRGRNFRVRNAKHPKNPAAPWGDRAEFLHWIAVFEIREFASKTPATPVRRRSR